MRVVSETPEEEIERRRAEKVRVRAEQQVRLALQHLAANAMRITRGAGDAEELELAAREYVKTLDAYRKVAKIGPSVDKVRRMLDVGMDYDALERMQYPDRTKTEGEEMIVRGSLQVAASRLIGQRLQELAGRDEIQRGLGLLKEAREAREEERRLERMEEKAAHKAGRPSRVVRNVSPPKGYFRSTRQKKAH
ncbi:hypothetical protein E9232_004914 [Inquilinus ginsengisoli]|uniref:Uncharacterized protein n=1 Tax=Inquilinus ginsengisoli TaxID=363840 RepID=A0ABU1JUS0_9PROT|nr:hypothetical protein [Inquilinus ginsengisoli]MDR6292374.1 hypothetical protein [Inquilinus ginsengisoli]